MLKVYLRAARETVPLEEYLLRYAVLDGRGNLDGHFIPINIARIACEHLVDDEALEELATDHACLTGDCPHTGPDDCVESLRAYVGELCEQIQKLKAKKNENLT